MLSTNNVFTVYNVLYICIYIHFMIKRLFTLQWVTHLSGRKYRVAIRLNLSYYLISVEITRELSTRERSSWKIRLRRCNAFVRMHAWCRRLYRVAMPLFRHAVIIVAKIRPRPPFYRTWQTERDDLDPLTLGILCRFYVFYWINTRDDFKPANIA